MTQIIYADVLVAVNIYVTYGLLRLTGIISHCELKRLKMVISSIIGGFFSLIIIIPNISDWVISLSRIPMSVALIFISFKISSKKQFLKIFVSFFCVNFIFAGTMFAVYYFFAPTSMLYNNGVVYFNINTITLVLLTCVCYVIMLIINSFCSWKVPKNMIYDIEIFFGGKSCSCKAFLDTGNSLTDPFNNYPVIVVNRQILQNILENNFGKPDYDGEILPRYIVCRGIAGTQMLASFMPEKVIIKSIRKNYEISKIYISVTDEKIKNGEFGALLNNTIFNSTLGGKYVGENQKSIHTINHKNQEAFRDN